MVCVSVCLCVHVGRVITSIGEKGHEFQKEQRDAFGRNLIEERAKINDAIISRFQIFKK